MLQKLFIKGLSALMLFALMLTLVPNVLHAENATASGDSAEEDVVINQSDTPLERYAKLRRTWAVYREVDSDQIYAITKERTKREVQTLAFFTAQNANYIVKLVREGRLAEIPTADPITDVAGLNPDDFVKAPWRCRLVKTANDSAVYLICGGIRRVIIREGVFHRYGWEFRDVETVSESELNEYEDAGALDEETVFEEDVEVATTEARTLRERLSERLNLRNKTQVRDRLVKAIGDSSIYVITPDGKRHHIRDLLTARLKGLNLRETTEVSQDELEAFEEGDEITSDTSDDVLDETVED